MLRSSRVAKGRLLDLTQAGNDLVLNDSSRICTRGDSSSFDVPEESIAVKWEYNSYQLDI